MSILYDKKAITQEEINDLLLIQEDWLIDKKGKDIKPAKLSKTISAFANTNGGDVYLGIAHTEDKTVYYWDGFETEESMNQHIEVVSNLFDSYEDYSLETYQSKVDGSFILHIVIHKTQKIIYASDGKAYINVIVGKPKGEGLSESVSTSEVKYIYNNYAK